MNGIGLTGAAVDADFIVEVVAGRAAGRAHAADLLAAGDVIAGLNQHRRHVAVAGGDAAAVVEFDHVAVAAAVPAGAEHGAVGGRIDRRAVGAGKVDSRDAWRRRAWNGSERTPKPLVKVTAVLIGLSEGMAMTPSCSWSSFFQLLNSALKVGLPTLSNGPPSPSGAAPAGLKPSRFSSAAVTW